MVNRPIRLAVRAVVLHDNKLLMVNAWRDPKSDLWCAPGGGAEPHQSLPENLIREIHEETGLTVSVGELCLVNEFHVPDGAFHQVDIYFRCKITAGSLDPHWKDPENVVTQRQFFSREELSEIRYKPDSLPDIAWGSSSVFGYDALEPLLR